MEREGHDAVHLFNQREVLISIPILRPETHREHRLPTVDVTFHTRGSSQSLYSTTQIGISLASFAFRAFFSQGLTSASALNASMSNDIL